MESKSFFKVAVFALVCGLFGFDSVKAADYEITGWVNPQGHTHSCNANGDCPIRRDTGYANVWDHKTNAGHNCQFCGVTVTIQDYTPRRVPVIRRVERKVTKAEWNPPIARGWNPPATRGWIPPTSVSIVLETKVTETVVPAVTVQYSLPTGLGGCSGAGCSTSYQPTGWYLGKNLRR